VDARFAISQKLPAVLTDKSVRRTNANRVCLWIKPFCWLNSRTKSFHASPTELHALSAHHSTFSLPIGVKPIEVSTLCRRSIEVDWILMFPVWFIVIKSCCCLLSKRNMYPVNTMLRLIVGCVRRGVTRGGKGGRNSPGAESLWERRIIAGGT